MNINKKFLAFLILYVKSLIVLLLFSALLFYLLYDFDIKKIYISNSLFIPNAIIFVLSVGINVGAGNLFNPLRYTASKAFGRKKNADKYSSYADYVEQKNNNSQNYWYVTLATLTNLVVAYVFTM